MRLLRPRLARNLKARPGSSKESKGNSTSTVSEQKVMQCEIKYLDMQWDDKDEQYFTERVDEVKKPEQKDWWRLFAFCLVRQFCNDEIETTRLFVNHQPLRQLLKDVIGDYPDDPINVDDVQIESPYHSLFFYRTELETVGLNRFNADEESAAQLKLLITWIKTHFESEIAAYNQCVSGGLKAISYDHLWTLFPPNSIIRAKVLNQDRAFRVHTCWYERGDNPILNFWIYFVDFNGERLGSRKAELFISKYVGKRQLEELTAMPLHLLEDADKVRAQLLDRGRKFEGYIGQHYEQYDGVALRKTEHGYARIHVKGRIMIDSETYHRLEAHDKFEVIDLGGASKPNKAHRKAMNHVDFRPQTKTYKKLSDDEAIITNATIRGYSFVTKQFLEFYVDKVSPVEWNTSCFDELVLDQATKKTVQAVVSMHSSHRDGFDDIVKGKGQGLVCVLHGPPGVGKTLTAECVAEYVKQPLLMVSSGDLGSSSGYVDAALSRTMDLASTWKAVLLIDEADVFLEQRSMSDLQRNAMVSVFLRALEYYSGILFLTTNRVDTFDEAFRSRIHVPIRYTNLTFASRLRIWRNLCARVPGGVDIDEEGMKKLAKHDFNGRQIKNIIKAGESLAAFDSVKLDFAQLEQVTKLQGAFEKDLADPGGVDYTAPGQLRKGESFRMYT